MSATPTEIARPGDDAAETGSPWRGAFYGALILAVAAGGWVRFSDRIADVAPALAPPVAGAVAAPASGAPQGLIELGQAAPQAGDAAIKALKLSGADTAALQQAVLRRRVRIVQMPLFERDGGTGSVVEVSAGGLTQMVRLSPEPTMVALPIGRVGNVSLRMLSPPPNTGVSGPPSVGMGALTLSGPVALPALPAGATLELGVVVQ